jgi:hypothetical protein
MRRRLRTVTVTVTVLVVALAPAVLARAASLAGFHATLQFQGTMKTVWSFPGAEVGDDGCYVSTTSGSGSQTADFNTHRQHVNVNIVDAGSTIAFQLENVRERASQNHFALGFRRGDVSRVGNEKTVYSKSVHWDSSCFPQPQESFADTGGCGDKQVPWDAMPLVAGSKLMPNVDAFLSSHMLSACPFFGPSNISGDESGSFPRQTQTHAPLSNVRSVLGKKHGKLIIRGQHRWHTEDKQGDFEVTATTTVQWKATLIRAHP